MDTRCPEDEPTGPRRIQLSRRPGWRKPAGAVSVARPGRWGNPFRCGAGGGRWWAEAYRAGGPPVRVCRPGRAQAAAVAGRDLACWCPPGQPCHAGVLIELANNRAEHRRGGPR